MTAANSTSPAGTYDFTVGVTDSEPTPVTVIQALSITVAPAATATATSSPTVTTGQSETSAATVTALVTPGGTTPIATFQNVALTATAPDTATWAVTYAAPGTHPGGASYSGDVATADSTSAATTVTTAAASVPRFTSAKHARAVEGEAFSFTVTTSGNPVPVLRRHRFDTPVPGPSSLLVVFASLTTRTGPPRSPVLRARTVATAPRSRPRVASASLHKYPLLWSRTTRPEIGVTGLDRRHLARECGRMSH